MTLALDRDAIREAIDQATAHLPPQERTAVAERVARAVARKLRRNRYPSPGALAHKIDPLTSIETPALAAIDKELVDAAHRLEAGEQVRLGVFMPPQEGKSRRVTIAFPLWLLVRNPELRIAIVSFEDNVAGAFSTPIRNWIVEYGSGTPNNPRPLNEDLLGITLRGDSTSKSRFDLAGHSGSVVAVGMKGGLTSKPVDVLIIDDPYKDRELADSETHRARVENWYRSVAIPRLPNASLVVLVQTRWHPNDLAGYLIASEAALPVESRRWRFVNIPAQAMRAPLDDDGEPKAGWLPDYLDREPGEFLASTRGRDAAGWQARRTEVGEMAWGSLYQQHPTPPEGAVFDYAHIARNRRPVGFTTPAARRAVAVDTSAGGSDVAGIIGGYRGKDGRVYVTHDRSARMTSAGWARQAWLMVVDTEADDLVWETNLAGPTMRQELVNGWSRIVAQVRTVDQVLKDAASPLSGLDHEPTREELLDEAARRWAATEQRLPIEDVSADPDDLAQFAEILDRLDGPLANVLDAMPAKLIGVHASKGKRVRATPVATAYETNKVSHVGTLGKLEGELTQWQEGDESPGRLDADVWLVTHLLAARRSRTFSAAAATLPSGTVTGR